MSYEAIINVHSVITLSGINGPGKRMVIFFQGCNHKCQGCFNPDTHPFIKKTEYPAESIIGMHYRSGIEGITVSGGEPFYQRRGLLQLLRSARDVFDLSTVVYTGFSYEKLSESSLCRNIFRYTDVLVDGRFEHSKKEPTTLARGSTNQRFHFLSCKYSASDFIMDGKIELIVGTDGTVTQTGFSKVA